MVPDIRARILRILQQSVLKAFGYRRIGIAEYAGNQPRNGIHHYHSRKLSAGQHIVSDRYGVGHDFLQDALIHTLIMTAQKDQILRRAEQEVADMVMQAAQKAVGGQKGAKVDGALYDDFLNKAGDKE